MSERDNMETLAFFYFVFFGEVDTYS